MKLQGVVYDSKTDPDANGRVLDVASVVLPDRDVPVTEQFDMERVVGSARLSIRGDQIWADVVLSPSAEAKYIAMLKSEDVFSITPAIGFKASHKTVDGRIPRVEILEIGLVDQNTDPSIPGLTMVETFTAAFGDD